MLMPQPCRICQTQTAAEFCSPECYEEYEAAAKPCPACHRPGWDCYCDDAYTITATEQYEDDLPASDYYDDIYDDGRFDVEDCPW
jgi:hypothetical protein